MQKVSSLVSSKIGDTLTNIKTWGPLVYNVLENGLIGDGVTDDTTALQTLINTAITAGRRTIAFPHTATGGEYFVTSLSNADQVDFVGDNCTFVGGYTRVITNFGDIAALEAETVTGIINGNALGAVGDWNGTSGTDNTTAIQAAINAAITEGKKAIWLENGVYRVDSAVTNADQVIFIGDNASIDGQSITVKQLGGGSGASGLVAVAGGTATAITLTIDGVSSYVNGLIFPFQCTSSNSASATTININGLGAKSAKKAYLLTPPNLLTGKAYWTWYDQSSDSFLIMEGAGNTLYFENNVNTIVQKDKFGSYQNIAYIDADDGLVHGSTDVRLTHIFQTPVNMFRHHVFSDFDEASTLDPRWTFTAISGGTNSQVADSKTKISSGTTSGGGGKLVLTNCNVPIISSQRIYFYMETSPNGNLDLTFGLEVDASNYIRFHRTDSASAGTVKAETANAGTQTQTDTLQAGDSVRRLYCIEIESPTSVKFWVGTDAGVLQLKATHTTNIPTGNHKAFIKLVNSTTVNRELLIDLVYLIAIR